MLLIGMVIGTENIIMNIIKEIVRAEKQKRSENDVERIYDDEPIIFTGTQMKNALMPKKYSEMRKISRSRNSPRMSDEEIFYLQARFMQDFEDDFEYKKRPIVSASKYADLSDKELRGYFSWRTKLRRGELEKAPREYASIYINELLNGVGYDTAEEGFFKLKGFFESFGEFCPDIRWNQHRCLIDYLVYNDLDAALLQDCQENRLERELLKLLDCENLDDDALFEAIAELSSYNVLKSKLYKLYPKQFERAACEAFRKMCAYWDKSRKVSYCENLFGRKKNRSYRPFVFAVFYDRKKYEKYEYRLSPFEKYCCENGRWIFEQTYDDLATNRELGELVKAVDRSLRLRLDVSPLKPQEEAKYVQAIIKETLDELFAPPQKVEAEIAQPAAIMLDLSKLDDIRSAADTTREMLMSEEEACMPEVCGGGGARMHVSEQERIIEHDDPLNAEEKEFIRKLLKGEDALAYTAELHIMPSIIVDGINERLFELFGDTVIDFEDEKPVLIEDYIEDLKGMMEK